MPPAIKQPIYGPRPNYNSMDGNDQARWRTLIQAKLGKLRDNNLQYHIPVYPDEPPEIRIIVITVISAIIFLFVKYLATLIDPNIVSYFHDMVN